MSLYMPCLKTSVSEIRAFEKLESYQKDNTLPLFELTKGRRTKNDKIGEIKKNIEKIKGAIGKRLFLLDITHDSKNLNSQLESLLMEKDGFENWYDFIKECIDDFELNICPVLQSNDNTTFSDILDQIDLLSNIVERIAIRIPSSDYYKYRDEGYKKLLSQVINGIPEDMYVYFICDSEDIREEDGSGYHTSEFPKCVTLINDFLSISEKKSFDFEIYHISSSFPASINGEVNKDSHGEADLFESELYYKVNNKIESEVSYGDYGCIYQFQKPFVAYNWVPRIDLPSDATKCIYYRYRDRDGGYKKCADMMVSDNKFKNLKVKCWGVNQVSACSQSKPTGKSPSFWISVRSNIWMASRSQIK